MSSVRRWWRRKAALLLLPHRVVRVGGSEPRRRRHLNLVLFEESRGVETSLLDLDGNGQIWPSRQT